MERKVRNTSASLRILAVVVVAVLSLIAFMPDAQAGPKGTDRPIEGTCDNDIIPLSPPGQFPVLLAVEVTCHISHLGLTVGFTDTEVIVPAGPTFDGTETFIGGTGRFLGTTARAIPSVSSLFTNKATLTIKVRISY